jgi:formate dehydrogenase maturation protein FdhE
MTFAVKLDLCPVCEANLLGGIYSTYDVITGNKIYRCKTCYTELVYTAYGWLKKE